MRDENIVQQDVLEAVYRKQAEKAIASFTRKRLKAEYTRDRKAALSRVLELIPPGASIGRGDSLTLDQLGVMSALRQSGTHQIFDPYAINEEGYYFVKGEERLQLQRQALLADVFLSGANAITLDGKVVCTDGNGNRVAAIIFGPKKVIIVAGVNKIVANLDEAFRRIHEVACPGNSYRHVWQHHASEVSLEKPCVKEGRCVDCSHIARGCCYTVIIEAARDPSSALGGYSREHVERVNIILVGKILGL